VLFIYIYITRLATNEIFSPSNKIHRRICRLRTYQHPGISVLGEKTVLQRNVFTMEEPGKGNGVPCITVGCREQDEVRKLKEFNMNGGCQYIK